MTTVHPTLTVEAVRALCGQAQTPPPQAAQDPAPGPQPEPSASAVPHEAIPGFMAPEATTPEAPRGRPLDSPVNTEGGNPRGSTSSLTRPSQEPPPTDRPYRAARSSSMSRSPSCIPSSWQDNHDSPSNPVTHPSVPVHHAPSSSTSAGQAPYARPVPQEPPQTRVAVLGGIEYTGPGSSSRLFADVGADGVVPPTVLPYRMDVDDVSDDSYGP